MRNKSYFFNRVPNSIVFIAIIMVLFLKITLYILLKNQFIGISLGGGSDANYYDGYAKGYLKTAVNTWPVILRYLNDLGLYSREVIAWFMFFLDLILIPLTTCQLAGLNFNHHQKYYFYLFLICSIYPTLYIFSLDIYRDVFMLFSFLVGCLLVKKTLNQSNLLEFIALFTASAAVGVFLIGLRPYLGYAFLLALILWKIRLTKKRVIVLGILYFLVLFIANYIGILDTLTEYRSGFEELEGGSTLGLDFSNPVMFIPNFIYSFLGQMLGLYVTNPLALILLLIETMPFMFMFIYIVKNIKFADNFVRFLIIFFVLYGSVWLIGNDNLGTAVRLRLYNYFAVYIAFFYILRLKSLDSRKLKVINK